MITVFLRFDFAGASSKSPFSTSPSRGGGGMAALAKVNYREPKTKAVLQRGRWPSGMLDMVQIKMKDYEFQRTQKLII